MIENIVFTIGTNSAQAFLSEFCTFNATRLRQYGIYYPDNLWGVINAGGYTQDLLGLLGTETEAHALPYHLRTVDDATHSLSPTPHTLFLAWYAFFLNTDRLTRLQAACREIFPQAKQRVLLCFARQDLDLEYWGHFFLQRYELPAFSVPVWLERNKNTKAPDYERCLRFLCDAFGNDAVYCSVPEPGAPANQAYLDTLCEALGLGQAQIKELGVHSFSPKHDILLPREVLTFASSTNFEHKQPAIPGSLNRWSFHAHKFTPESGYIGSPHSLMGPTLRAEILKSFAATNATAAEMLGLPRLFPDPEPEPDWEPWTGLTPYIAYTVAERMDADFVRQLIEPFEKLPMHYKTRDQRIVHQALRDALGQPSATPLIRPHRQEPKLSVLTATYNHADYIAECIESVLAQQTDFPFQHIIADDGSNDGTQGIILNYAAKYPHIVPVFQKKRSFGAGNLRALFDMARTEYVAICEGDDYFTDPTKLQTQVDFLKANPYCALCFHVVRVTHEGDPESDHLYPLAGSMPGGVRPFYYLTDLIRKNFFQTNSVMYRWRFKNGLPDWFRTDLMPGDLYWHLLHAETGKIGFIDKAMGVYRRHKKGVYYLAAVDKLKHRAKTGMKEIEVFDVINRHFNRVYEPILLDATDNIFADCAVYDETRAKQEGMEPVFTKMCEKYPEMAWHFLQSMKNAPQ